jgi:hypothetical protein
LLVTDLDRSSILSDPATARTVNRRIDKEGSSTSANYVGVVRWALSGRGRGRTAELTLGARAVPSLLRLLRARLPHGRDFGLLGSKQAVCFTPGSSPAFRADGETLVVELPDDVLRDFLGKVEPRRGTYTSDSFPRFRLTVEPTQIRNQEGEVVETIG